MTPSVQTGNARARREINILHWLAQPFEENQNIGHVLVFQIELLAQTWGWGKLRNEECGKSATGKVRNIPDGK